MRRGRFAAAVLVGFLVLAGCSDDGGSGETTPPSTGEHGTSTTATTAPLAVSRALPVTVEAAPDLPGYNVARPTDLDATGAPLPVVVWANGGCVRFDGAWRTLLDRWAAAGFVVVSITATPGVEPSLTDMSSPDDQARAIDWAAEQNEDGPYAGHLDLDRVVAAGNSCGGITSLGLAGRDPRVSAVFVLSGSSVGPGAAREQAAAVMDDVKVPVGFAVGGAEDIASSQATQDYELLGPGIPGYVASRTSGDHVTVSTDVGVLADVAEIGINWFDLVLYGNASALAALEDNPCGDCPPGQWTVQAKNLESLVEP